jgi:hypothetical protein
MKHFTALFLLILLVLPVLSGCRPEPPDKDTATPPDSTPSQSAKSAAAAPAAPSLNAESAAAAPTPLADSAAPEPVGCRGCHPTMIPDTAHNLPCTTCHGGIDQESDKDKAHAGLIARPAHPDHMAQTCGGCHKQQVADARHALHFTLSGKINAIRRHFGADTALTSPAEIPVVDSPDTAQALADDMLRRRCLRCHVFSRGDAYPARAHGTGCAACHLSFTDGAPAGHHFTLPGDNQCLSCHTANFVGSDYYGRFEHDYRWEFRTPYTPHTPDNTAPRPHGLEFHQLAPDIHQQRGLLCIDCHRNSGHIPRDPITCADCHGWKPGRPLPNLHVQAVDGTLRLTSRAGGTVHTIPPLRHPAHAQYGSRVACQVCHGQWSVNDAPTHLLLSYEDDYDPWHFLTVQGSAEIEQLLEHNLYASHERPMTMQDGLTGAPRDGLWYQGFGQRRWEELPIAMDTDGMIKVFRPILDLCLSMLTADNITGHTPVMRPYTPHTTGHAGVFYQDRFRHLLLPNRP